MVVINNLNSTTCWEDEWEKAQDAQSHLAWCLILDVGLKNVSWKWILPNCFYSLHYCQDQIRKSIFPHSRLHWVLLFSSHRCFLHTGLMPPMVDCRYSHEQDPGPFLLGAHHLVEETRGSHQVFFSAGRGGSRKWDIAAQRSTWISPTHGALEKASWRRWHWDSLGSEVRAVQRHEGEKVYTVFCGLSGVHCAEVCECMWQTDRWGGVSH